MQNSLPPLPESGRGHLRIIRPNIYVDQINHPDMGGVYKEPGAFRKLSEINLNLRNELPPYCKNFFDEDPKWREALLQGCAEGEEQSHPLLVPITEKEVQMALAKGKSKAPSNIGISPSNLREIALALSTPLMKLFSSIQKSNTVPSKWLESSVIVIHKKGLTSDPDNFRTIAKEKPIPQGVKHNPCEENSFIQ